MGLMGLRGPIRQRTGWRGGGEGGREKLGRGRAEKNLRRGEGEEMGCGATREVNRRNGDQRLSDGLKGDGVRE